MLVKTAILAFFGLCAGGVISAGIFAFITTIGVVQRLVSKTATSSHILLIESFIIVGGIFGNLVDLYEFPLYGGVIVLIIGGLSVGIFVGSIVMSLAETLKALPIMNRRIRLAVGIQYVILSIGIGKLVGSMLYFYNSWSA